MATRFEKVSYEQFAADVKSNFKKHYDDKAIEEMYNSIILPARSDPGSAGYDIRTPVGGIVLRPGEGVKIPTGIRAIMPSNLFLAIFPRSGLGFKYRLQLDNTVGIIDSSYAEADNEGHIFVKITNDSRKDQEIEISPNDRICQGIFMPFAITDDDKATGSRTGGMGSTGVK